MKTLTLIWLLLVYLFFNSSASAQNADSSTLVSSEFTEVYPQPIDGWPAIYIWVAEQFSQHNFNRLDTLDCSNNNAKVLIFYIVDENGKIERADVGKGIGEPYDEFCRQIIQNMPIRWQPGSKNGIPVKVRLGFPFHFCHNSALETKSSKKRKKKKR